ncbi:MAG: hypothetical protein HUU46_16880 [Candidatus Hydrogenedentes bacterium]|nr:hypothetical protein [Candidatus Hydrogenedentota bacterium]
MFRATRAAHYHVTEWYRTHPYVFLLLLLLLFSAGAVFTTDSMVKTLLIAFASASLNMLLNYRVKFVALRRGVNERPVGELRQAAFDATARETVGAAFVSVLMLVLFFGNTLAVCRDVWG